MATDRHTYIIAEAGVNHNGSLEIAKELVDAAADAGADAVKFQTFKAENLVNIHAPQAEYQTANIGKTESQYAMLKRLELSEAFHFELFDYCKTKNITFLSTPFDKDSLKFLIQNFDMPFLKIGSGEITNAPFLLEIAKTGKNIILSTGMSTLEEVREALSVLAFGFIHPNKAPNIEAFRNIWNDKNTLSILNEKVTILHCTTEYPCPLADVNLNAMHTMKDAFGLDVGYSDHTSGIEVTLTAVAMGASVIEKHFTIDKNMDGPDHKASLEPEELKLMISKIRKLEALNEDAKQSYLLGYSNLKEVSGSGDKVPSPSELKNKPVARKSLVAKSDIAKGERYTEENICVKRPGNGIAPIQYWSLIGTISSQYHTKDEVIL